MAEDNVKAQMRKGILSTASSPFSPARTRMLKIIAELKQAEMIVVEVRSTRSSPGRKMPDC